MGGLAICKRNANIEMKSTSRRDLRPQLIADLEQIEDNIALYQDGRDSAYQTVALQLRNLLLGGRRGLLLRVLPNAAFHPMVDQPASNDTPGRKPEVHSVTLFGHAEFRPPSGGGRGQITLAIDTDQQPIPPQEWLRQWVVSPDIKIEQLIRSTANEEVAHTEDERGALLTNLAGSGVMAISEADLKAGRLDRARVVQEMYQVTIIGIGKYVAQRVRELLDED